MSDRKKQPAPEITIEWADSVGAKRLRELTELRNARLAEQASQAAPAIADAKAHLAERGLHFTDDA